MGTSSTGGFVNSYSYNANGEQTGRTLSGTAYTLAYDYDGQLLSTSTGGSVQSSFVYDATGRRVSRTNGGTTTKFYYGAGHILVEKQGSITTAVYTYGNGLIRKDGEIPLFDGQGNERIVTNASETQISGINFDGFGNTIGTFGSSTSSYMYGAQSGYRTEGDAGLSQVGARYYDAQVGRFITRDTYLDQAPYLYCDHDPVNATDPSGHAGVLGKVWDWIMNTPENMADNPIMSGPAGVAVRAVAVFGPFYIAAIVVVRKYKKNWKNTNPPGSLGGENAGTRQGQADQVEKFSDPDRKDDKNGN